jgi:nitroimidazol reductase NimA-like FMN-containing flavoprotein (pyridoxamine 5'-phosphate oxidase superfamily)
MSAGGRREMTPDEINAYLASPVLARIATVRGQRPHVVPIWFDWDGARLWMETGLNFQKHRNLLRNPECTVVVDTTEGGLRFKGVAFEGRPELLTEPLDAVRAVVVRIYTKYLGPDGILEPTPQRMINARHVIIKLTPRRVRSWDYTRAAG